MQTTDIRHLTKLMEGAIDHISTAKGEVEYILNCVRHSQGDKHIIVGAIEEEFATLKNTSGRLLSYLLILASFSDNNSN